MGITVLNFTHPLTDSQLGQIEQMSGEVITAVFNIPASFDVLEAIQPQIQQMIEQVPLTADEWQTTALLVNPPGLAPAACVLLAEIHGRAGYFPPIIRIRPMSHSIPLGFEVAELCNLQTIRDHARQTRFGETQ